MNNIYVLMSKMNNSESTIIDVFASLKDAMKTKQHIYNQCTKKTQSDLLDLFIEEVELKYAPNFKIELHILLERKVSLQDTNMIEKLNSFWSILDVRHGLQIINLIKYISFIFDAIWRRPRHFRLNLKLSY